MADITGREPSLSGEYNDQLREAYLVIPTDSIAGGSFQICLGIYPKDEAMRILLNVCEFHWPGKCKWDDHGQLQHEDDHTFLRGFLWDPARPKR